MKKTYKVIALVLTGVEEPFYRVTIAEVEDPKEVAYNDAKKMFGVRTAAQWSEGGYEDVSTARNWVDAYARVFEKSRVIEKKTLRITVRVGAKRVEVG